MKVRSSTFKWPTFPTDVSRKTNCQLNLELRTAISKQPFPEAQVGSTALVVQAECQAAAF